MGGGLGGGCRGQGQGQGADRARGSVPTLGTFTVVICTIGTYYPYFSFLLFFSFIIQ